MNKNGIPIALYVWSTAVLVSRFSMITIIFRITSWAAIITHTISESKTPGRNDDKLTRKVLHAVYPRIGTRNVHHYIYYVYKYVSGECRIQPPKSVATKLENQTYRFRIALFPRPVGNPIYYYNNNNMYNAERFFFLQSYCSNIMYDLVLEANTRVELVLLKGRVQPSLVRKWRL